MNIRMTAEKNILKRKLRAEEIAEKNLTIALQDEDIRLLFIKCKKLVVEIAKLEVAGKSTKEKKKEYDEARELLAQYLKANGLKKEDMKPKYNCSICKDTGYVRGKECVCLKREISLELIKASGLDIKNMAKFNDDYSVFPDDVREKVKNIYTKMKKFIDEATTTEYNNILILGGTGVGKTHLLECMATYSIKKGKLIKYVSAFNFNQDMLKYHCANIEDKSEIMREYLDCDLLFIDDLGTENQITNVTNEYLYSVLSERMQNNKKTIITSNLTFDQIQDSYGERIFSRLMHKKQSLKINFEGVDLRIKNTSVKPTPKTATKTATTTKNNSNIETKSKTESKSKAKTETETKSKTSKK